MDIPNPSVPVQTLAMHVPSLVPLDTSEVRRLWALYLRGGVVAALEHDTEGAMPEDVFASLMGGHAQLWLAYFNDDPAGGMAGFIVTREIFTPGGKELLVWLGYHNGEDETRCADYMPQIADFARLAGCQRVTVESPRPYHRAVPGFTLARHVFHYEVQ